MSKRFTDTKKWIKPWFSELDPKSKLAWIYLCDVCDNAGIVELNERLMSFQLGFKVTYEKLEQRFGERIKRLADNKLFIVPFIEFQYDKLSEDCRPHLPIIRTLNKYGIDYKKLDLNNLTPKQTRKRITQATRQEIFARDSYECQYCGSHENLTIDHITPLSKGGGNENENLATCCVSCNCAKGELSLPEFLEKLKEKERVSKKLDRVSNFLNRVSKSLDTLKDKDKEKEQEKETKGGLGEKEPFADFWAVYPKQRIGNKDKARAAFLRAVKRSGLTAEQITAKAAEYAQGEEVARGYAKGAEAWLNDDRFLRSYGPTRNTSKMLEEARREGQAKIDEIFGGSK